MSTQKKIREEIDRNQQEMKARLVELYTKLKAGDLTDEERGKLAAAIQEIKGNLEPKTRAACRHFGIPTDSELMRVQKP